MTAMLQYGVKRIFVMGTPSAHEPQEWNIATYRPDVADWLVDQVGKEVPEYVRQRPALSSRKKMFPIEATDASLNTPLGAVK